MEKKILTNPSNKNMSELSNEKDFTRQLEEISELYENSKDCLLAIQFPSAYSEKEVWAKIGRLYENLERLRNIACMGLKSKHNIGDN